MEFGLLQPADSTKDRGSSNSDSSGNYDPSSFLVLNCVGAAAFEGGEGGGGAAAAGGDVHHFLGYTTKSDSIGSEVELLTAATTGEDLLLPAAQGEMPKEEGGGVAGGGRSSASCSSKKNINSKSYSDYLSEVILAPTSPHPHHHHQQRGGGGGQDVTESGSDSGGCYDDEELLIDDNDDEDRPIHSSNDGGGSNGNNGTNIDIELLSRHATAMDAAQSTPRKLPPAAAAAPALLATTTPQSQQQQQIMYETPLTSITVVHNGSSGGDDGAGSAAALGNGSKSIHQALSPFSPLLKKRRQQPSSSSVRLRDQDQQLQQLELTLASCRKVSVVVRVEPLHRHLQQQQQQREHRQSCDAVHDSASNSKKKKRTSNSGSAGPKVCLFPLVLPSSAGQQQHQAGGSIKLEETSPISVDVDGEEGDGSSPDSSPSAKSAAFWKRLEGEDDEEEDVGKNKEAAAAASTPQPPSSSTKLDSSNIEYSSRDLIVVNPTAFGRDIPSEITLERARLVSQVARQSSVEDWIRTYKFAQVLWPEQQQQHQQADTVQTSSRKKRVGGTGGGSAADSLSSSCPSLKPLCQAMASDVCQPGSISVRTVISVGQSIVVGASASSADGGGANGSTTATAQPIYSKTTTLFGSVAHDSVAHVISTQVSTDEEALDSFGLVGLTAQYIFNRLGGNSNYAQQLTLSVLEIDQEDALYDLQKTKPFHPHHLVTLRHSGSGDEAPGSVATAGGGATLHGLLDHPVDSLKAVGRCLRRALSMAYHPKRNNHPSQGSILAILKLWRIHDGTSKCMSMVQFLDLAQTSAIPATAADSSSSAFASPSPMLNSSPLKTLGSPNLDGMSSPQKSTLRRNAMVRQSVTALGGILRRLLLSEAGNDTILSWRDFTITKVLQKSFLQSDSKIVVLASVSPHVDDYEATLATLRYVHNIYTSPSGRFISPFQQQLSESKCTSPTSRSLTEDEENDTDSLSFRLGFEGQTSSLLRNIVGDPRQRMAKVMPKRRKRMDDNGLELNDEYTPTTYMLPTPLVQNHAMEQQRPYWNDELPEDGGQEELLRPLETSNLIDAMERGGEYGRSDDEPSPLTADTREQLVKHARAMQQEEGRSFGRGSRERSLSEQMEDLSLELREKTHLSPEQNDAVIQAVAAAQEYESLRREVEEKDRYIQELSESLRELKEQHDYSAALDGDHQIELEEAMERQLQELQQRDEQMAMLREDLEKALAGASQDEDNDREEQLRQQIDLLRDELAQRDLQVQQLQASSNDSLRVAGAASADSEEGREQLQQQLSLVTEELKRRNEKIEQLQSSKSPRAASQATTVADSEKHELERQLDAVAQELTRRHHDVQILEQSLESSRRTSGEEIQDLRRQMESMKAQLDSRNFEIQQQQRVLEAAKLEHSHAVERLLSDRESLEKEASGQQQQLSDELERLRRALTSRDEEISHLRKAVEETESQYEDSMAQVVAQIAAERDQAEEEANDARQHLRTVQEERAQETSLWQEQIEQLQRDLESSKQRNESQEAKWEAAGAERERAVQQVREAQQELENERQNNLSEQNRREEEVEYLRNTADRFRVHHEQSLEKQNVLIAERDALQEARHDLETEVQDVQSALQLREDEIQKLERMRLEQEYAQDELVQELMVERDVAIEEAQAIRAELESELERIRSDVQSSDSSREKAAETLRREVEELREAVATREDRIIELKEYTEKARRQYQQAKQELEGDVKLERQHVEQLKTALHEMEDESDQYRKESSHHQEEVRRLQTSLETISRKLESSQKELKQERSKVDHASQSSQQLLNLELEGYQLEVSRRDEEIRELQEHLERTKTEHARWKEETEAAMLAEVDKARKQAAEVKQLSDSEAQRYTKELSDREGRINELQASIKKLQAEVSEAYTLADDAIGKVSDLEKSYRDLESAHEVMSQKLQASREEVLRLQAELEDSKLALKETECNLTSVESERDLVRQRESDHSDEIDRLRKQLLDTQEDAESAAQERDRLAQEHESEFRRLLEAKDNDCKRHLEELSRLRQEISNALEEQQSRNDCEVSRLQEQLALSEKALAGGNQRCEDLEQKLSEQVEARDRLAREHEQTRMDLENRLRDVEELSTNLSRILEEKEEAVGKVGNLKRALSEFQDVTRSKVENFVHHRTETKVLLEKTLEENEALQNKNQELQAALEDFKRNDGIGISHEESLSMLKKAREENIELGKTIRKLQECFRDREYGQNRIGLNNSAGSTRHGQQRLRYRSDGGVTVTPLLRRTDSAESSATRDSTAAFALPPAASAEALLRRTLEENALLAAENRKLHSSLRGQSSSHDVLGDVDVRYRTRLPPLRLSDSASAPGADELVASIALAAKRRVERSNAESGILREELRARETYNSLSNRVQSLEGQVAAVGGRPLNNNDEKVTLLDSGNVEDKYDALVRRVRTLERLVEERRTTSPSGAFRMARHER